MCTLLLSTGVSFVCVCFVFFFQAEDGIRDLVRSRGLGDVYKRQVLGAADAAAALAFQAGERARGRIVHPGEARLFHACLLYTSDAADDLLCVDLGGRRIIKKKNIIPHTLASDTCSTISATRTHTHY